jgi:integrase
MPYTRFDNNSTPSRPPVQELIDSEPEEQPETAVEEVVQDDPNDFGNLHRLYIAERKAGGLNNQKTINYYIDAWNLYCEILAAGFFDNKSLLSTTAVRFYKQHIINFPSNRSKRPKYRNKDVAQLVQMNIPEKDCMSPNTINNHINRLSLFGKWLVDNKYIDANPFEGMKIKLSVKYKGEKKRGSFKVEQLISIFSQHIFTEHDYNDEYNFWVPILGLFTGCRLGEICQAMCKDIIVVDGVHCLAVSDDGDGQRTKTESSLRVLPLHQSLLDLGFLAFVQERKTHRDARLFDLERNQYGEFAQASKFFARLCDRAGVTDKSVDFHAFRHTITKLAKDAKVPFLYIKDYVGHSTGDITADRYGSDIDFKVIKSEFDRIDFQHILDRAGVRLWI